jgi:hypothetical protein
MKRVLIILVPLIVMAITMALMGIASAQDDTKAGNTDLTTAPEAAQSTNQDGQAAAKAGSKTTFKGDKGLVRSTAAEAHNCLDDAKGTVTVIPVGDNQILDIDLSGMPKKTDFTVFVLQQADSPFGVAWYQGDITTDKDGKGEGRFKGIFSSETHAFALSPPIAAHQVDGKDATTDVPFGPIHTPHLGVWFADPADAAKAGCSNTSTPFDGDHEAGIQALSTKKFNPADKTDGPLLHV